MTAPIADTIQIAEAVRQTSLQTTVIHSDADALREWRLLDQRLQHDSVTSSWEWVDTWIRYFGDLPHEFFLLRDGSQPVGIALLVRGLNGWGPMSDRRIHFGTAGEPAGHTICAEYQRPLVAEEHREAFFRLLFQHLDRDPRWDTLHFDGLDGRLVPSLLSIRPATTIRRVPSHYFDLRETRALGQDVLSRMGNSTKRALRQNLKHFPDVTIEWSETPEQADSIFADLIRMHQDRWTRVGQPGCFSSERFTEFHRDLLHRWQGQGKVILTRVRQGDLLLGCSHLFVERNRLLLYQCGSARFDDKSSPGLISDYLTMQQGLERNFDAYDFLAGDAIRKSKLSTHVNELVWLAWRRPRWKFRALAAFKALRQRLRPTIPARCG